MEYTLQIDINLPRKQVVELFLNTNTYRKWHTGLVSVEHLEGSPNEIGSRSKFIYSKGKKRTILYRTVSVSDLPREYSLIYENDSLKTLTRNHFLELDERSTRMISEFSSKGNGLIMKSMTLMIPRAFRKQSEDQLALFKQFAEKHYSEAS